MPPYSHTAKHALYSCRKILTCLVESPFLSPTLTYNSISLLSRAMSSSMNVTLVMICTCHSQADWHKGQAAVGECGCGQGGGQSSPKAQAASAQCREEES